MKSAHVGALAAMLIMGAVSHASASFERFKDSPAATAIAQRDIVAETRLYCMALAIFFEGGSTAETEEGQRHIARVVHERAKANERKWGGSDICDVVFYKRKGVCQFSFACLPLARRTPRGGAAWDYSMTIAQEELEGRSELLERSIRYYMNASLTPARNACRFRKEFVKVVDAGRHEFFREPSRAELAELSKTEFVECKRAKAKATKSAARKAAKQKRLAKLSKKKRIRSAAAN
jgi:hypothetical protein